VEYLTANHLVVSDNEPVLVGKTEGPTHAWRGDSVAEHTRVAQEFASLLYLEVLKAMRASISQGGLFEANSLPREIYTSMFDAEIARLLARRGYEGISQTVERAIENTVPIGRNPPSAEAAVKASTFPRSAAHLSSFVGSTLGVRGLLQQRSTWP
jgi:Rod binding domain-containing protein